MAMGQFSIDFDRKKSSGRGQDFKDSATTLTGLPSGNLGHRKKMGHVKLIEKF